MVGEEAVAGDSAWVRGGVGRESDLFAPCLLPGSDVVDWLYHHVEGFPERREARKYASGLLKAGLIRHTVNKITFSEQCYYVFGDLSGGCESCKSAVRLWQRRPP